MSNDDEYLVSKIHLDAIDKISRLQRSPRYRSFFNAKAIEAFNKVESSALAGKSIPHTEHIGSKGDDST